MRYGDWFRLVPIPGDLIQTVEGHVAGLALEVAQVIDPEQDTRRSSRVTWIKDAEIRTAFLDIAKQVNRDAQWDFDIDVLEPMQYTYYVAGDEYGWHVDQHRKPYIDDRVRKFSFSVMLNEDFEGGDFDLELYSPTLAQRVKSFSGLSPNTGLFFQADYWHRVQPVTKGVRRSLVGWVLGKKFR